MDWRLLYIYSLMTAIGRRVQEAGGTVVAGNSWLLYYVLFQNL